MACSTNRKFHARRPRLLKDFLNEEYNCCHHHACLSQSPCKRPASVSRSTAISGAINKVINIVKFLPLVKSPSILPRSISRKLSRRSTATDGGVDRREEVHAAALVKVKDILRWRSFREEIDKSRLLDDEFVLFHCTTTTTGSSNRSSWCDSDFTAEDLPSWCGEIGDNNGKNKDMILPHEGAGGHFVESTVDKQMGPQCFDENEQHSPISVLETPFREEDDEDEKAKEMMMTMMIHLADIKGCSDESYEWEVEEKREAYIRDMEKAAGMRWYNFDEEKQEICKELELEVFNVLINEVLLQLF